MGGVSIFIRAIFFAVSFGILICLRSVCVGGLGMAVGSIVGVADLVAVLFCQGYLFLRFLVGVGHGAAVGEGLGGDSSFGVVGIFYGGDGGIFLERG